MKVGLRILNRRVGHDVRAWPTLALLLLVVLVAVGCVLWFMSEAMRNERMAVREKIGDAYHGQLSLLQTQTIERWNRLLSQFDSNGAAPEKFSRAVEEGWASSLICYDEQGNRAYPQQPHGAASEIEKSEALQSELRVLAQAGNKDEVAQFVIARFAAPNSSADAKAERDGAASLPGFAKPRSEVDAQGRLISANAELLALELLNDKDDPRFGKIAARLRARLANYASETPPAGQRRFIMRALEQLDPSIRFPTLAGEDLAARYLDANSAIPSATGLHSTDVPGVWAALSPGRRAVALFTIEKLREWIASVIKDVSPADGVKFAVLAPGEEPLTEPAPILMPLGPDLPGWRLSLAFDDRTLFDAESAKRLKLHVVVASGVIAAMTALAFLIARSLGRQVTLARIKNDLVATVSHELKTPLTAMRALVETLLETEKLEEKTTREYLQMLAGENERLSRLIDNFLTFSRLERNKYAFQFTRIQPRTVVEAAVAALGQRGPIAGCHLECRAPADLPIIIGDLDALTTALLNLLDNAVKYTGAGKRITVSCATQEGRVRFSVEDNGIGLSKEERQRVFRRFYQVDQRLSRTAGGCGLGLSIVQSIVEAHGGSAGVTSEPGRGSIFSFEIPNAPTARE